MSSKKSCLFFVLAIMIQSTVFADCLSNSCSQNISQTLWQPRPFSSYKTREIMMLQDYKQRDNLLSFSMEHMQNFGNASDRLGSLPFWSGSNTMTIGSNDGNSDLDAYQFGLGEATAQGSITLDPKVQHIGGEMLVRLMHKPNERSAYLQFKIPVVAMMIDTRVCETPAKVDSAQDADWSLYPIQSIRYKTLKDALTSDFVEREPDLIFARLHPGKNTAIRSGDIEAAVGYNFYSSDKGYFGAGLKVSCPTGNVPSAEYILEPIVGRAGHWSVGAEFHGNCTFHTDNNCDVALSMRGDVLYLTSGRTPHWRTFDLALNGPGSKYLLVQRYLPMLESDGTESWMPGEILPAADITTVPVLSTFSTEGSFALACNVQKDNWNISLSGEVWARAHERLQIDCYELKKEKEQSLNHFAVLGRQINEKDIGTPLPDLHYCEPLARINKSVDRQTTTNSFPNDVKDATKATNRISVDHNTALDIAGAQAPRVVTGKLTAECGYTWTEHEKQPHISLFGGIELANQRSKFDHLWSVGLQGSMIF